MVSAAARESVGVPIIAFPPADFLETVSPVERQGRNVAFLDLQMDMGDPRPRMPSRCDASSGREWPRPRDFVPRATVRISASSMTIRGHDEAHGMRTGRKTARRP